jgi:hypothetical protein
LVPLTKFKNENIIKFHEYIEKMECLPDKTKLHFLDEKHLVNMREQGCLTDQNMSRPTNMIYGCHPSQW